MKKDQHDWTEEVLQSMKGSHRAKPGPDLFLKIKNQIKIDEAKVISIAQWKWAAAVAVMILFINITALVVYNRSETITEDYAVINTYGEPLLTTYQIFE